MGRGTAPLGHRGQSQEAARKGGLWPGRHIQELFITGVASEVANEVTLRELVESVESRSLSLSHSHLALGRRTDGEGTGMDVKSGEGQPGRQRRTELALSGQRDVNGRAGKGTSMQREQREQTQRLRGLNGEAVFRDGY